MKALSNSQLESISCGEWSDLSYACKLSWVGFGLAYAGLFCVTGVVGAAVAVGSLALSPVSVALSCS